MKEEPKPQVIGKSLIVIFPREKLHNFCIKTQFWWIILFCLKVVLRIRLNIYEDFKFQDAENSLNMKKCQEFQEFLGKLTFIQVKI